MLGPAQIKLGQSAGIMRGEPDAHAVVDIEPLRMVVHALAHESHMCHEAESRGKVLELQFAFEGTAFISE